MFVGIRDGQLEQLSSGYLTDPDDMFAYLGVVRRCVFFESALRTKGGGWAKLNSTLKLLFLERRSL